MLHNKSSEIDPKRWNYSDSEELLKKLVKIKVQSYFRGGELAEWSIAAVLKTVDCNRSGGSNPSLSANK